MKELQIKTELGIIKYNAPNIPQRLRLLSKIGASPTEGTKDLSFDMLADVVDHVGSLVTSVNLKVKGKSVTTWDDALNSEECMEIVLKLATNVLMPEHSEQEAAKKAKVKKR